MNRSLELELKVGIFVAIGLVLVMISILLLGGAKSMFSANTVYRVHFKEVEGLLGGAVVKLAGVKVGQVQDISISDDNSGVDLRLLIYKKFAESIHKDCVVGLRTQGVLGDKYISISRGTSEAGIAEPGTVLQTEEPKDLKDYLNSADEVIGRLKNSLKDVEGILSSFNKENRAENFFRNLSSVSERVNTGTEKFPAAMGDLNKGMNHFNSILTKVDNGQGTLGALINDPALYDDLRTLLGGANRNRVLKFFVNKSIEESRAAKKDEASKK